MKRVLVIAYCFPPEPFPGAQRPGYLARYASKFGWDVTVLTHTAAEPPFPARVVRAGAAKHAAVSAAPASARRTSPLRTALHHVKQLIAFPDEEIAWAPSAIYRALQEMRRTHYDAILSTALPVSSHIVAACVSSLTRTPWIADYRDPWSTNAYMPWGPIKRRLHRLLEFAVIPRAAHITTVSEQLAQHLGDLHGRRVLSIENAYDPQEWLQIPDEQPAGFDLIFTGTMYGGKRSPELLFRALARMKAANDPLAEATRVHFYGPNNAAVVDEAKRHGVDAQVIVHGIVPRVEAMAVQRRAAALLIFLNMDPATAGEKGSKYLEHLGAQRRILAFGPPNSALRAVIDRLGVGEFASDDDEAERALRNAYQAYCAGQYRITPDANAVNTAERLASRFAELLDDATSSPAPASSARPFAQRSRNEV